MSETKAKAKTPGSKSKSHQEDPIMTYTEAAKLLGKHRSTVARWASEGLVKAGRFPSGLPCIRKSEVDKMLGIIQSD